jgi:hypothetical protein
MYIIYNVVCCNVCVQHVFAFGVCSILLVCGMRVCGPCVVLYVVCFGFGGSIFWFLQLVFRAARLSLSLLRERYLPMLFHVPPSWCMGAARLEGVV